MPNFYVKPNKNLMKKILLDNNEITLELEGGIVVAKFKVEHFDLQTVQRLVEDRKKIFLFPKLVAKELMRQLINSPVGSIIGNFYIRIKKPLRPVRLFTDKLKAKKWFVQFAE